MANSRKAKLDETFFALSHPTRRAILARLARGETTVSRLSKPFKISAPAVSKHLRVLQRAGLVEQERQGRVRRCRLAAAPLREAADFVERYRRFWDSQMKSLAGGLKKKPTKQKTPRKRQPRRT